jgi:hypothetical protein
MEEKFENSDIYFVAGAVSYGSIVEKTDDRDGRVFFHLSNCPRDVYLQKTGELSTEAVKDFNHLFHLFKSRCLMLPPTYPNSLKDMKALLYDR